MKGRRMKCPCCGGTGVLTDWQPQPKFDPMMRQYRCRSCRALFYVMLTEEQIKDVKLQKH